MRSIPKKWLLLSGTLIAVISVFLLPPIAQSLSYHDFADKRSFSGIPDFANVISNIPFLFVGITGLHYLKKATVPRGIFLIYAVMFFGIFLTGLGSEYYHYSPNDDTLVFDRIPMTLVFMSLLSATIAELIDERAGRRLLVPLLLAGVISVLWWHIGERKGHGDLRLYGLVQFYPILFIPLIYLLFYDPVHTPALRPLCQVVIWYGIAKVFEILDWQLYDISGLVSGHTLKHLAAAVSTFYLVKLFRVKYMSTAGPA